MQDGAAGELQGRVHEQHVCGCTTLVLLAKMVAGTICCRLKTGNGASPSHFYPLPHLLVKTVIPNCTLNTTAHILNVHFMRLKKQKKVTYTPEGEKYSGEQRNFTIKASAISQM